MMLNDVKTIVENLEDFIELPGCIERLRKAVLILAVSGKLVPQDTSEGTAEELYLEISKQNKKTPSAPVSREDFPFDIPESWKWVRLRDTLLNISGGGTPSKQNAAYWEGVIPWASTKDLTGKKYLHDTEDHISELGLKSKPGILKPSGSIVVCTRMGLGKIAILTREMAINQDLKALLLNGMVIPEFFYLRYKTLSIKGKGVTVDGIRQNELLSFLYPIPPLDEQSRIVTKVEEVLRLLDTFETKKQERDEVRKRLTRNAMHSLGLGDAEIALQNLQELVKTPNDVKELEKSILTLAVSGRLVRQRLSEGNAESLYIEIKKARAANTVKKKSKIGSTLPSISLEDVPSKIPESWKWMRLGDCMSISSGDSLRVSEANDGDYLVYGGNGIAGRHTAFNTRKGSIVIGRVGALCGIARITDTDAWVTDNAFVVSYPENLLNREFFVLLLNQLSLRGYHRGSAQPVISGISVYPVFAPLPPLAEQVRIIKKVEEMMELIRSLKAVLSR